MTRGEVGAEVTRLITDKQNGLPITVERQTIAQLLDKWLEDAIRPHVRPKTYISYEQVCRLYIKAKLDRIGLAKLGPQHVQQMINELTEEVSEHTPAYARLVLRAALNRSLK